MYEGVGMTEPASTISMWSTLVPVMVGGAIGLIGGWLGPWLVERRKEAAEEKKKLAEKFEELIAALYEHKHWLDMMEQIWVLGTDEKRSMSPFARVHAISRVYFPEFESQIAALEVVARKYEMWMFHAAKNRLINDGAPSLEGLEEAYRPYAEKFRTLLNELGEFAKREFQ